MVVVCAGRHESGPPRESADGPRIRKSVTAGECSPTCWRRIAECSAGQPPFHTAAAHADPPELYAIVGPYAAVANAGRRQGSSSHNLAEYLATRNGGARQVPERQSESPHLLA